MFASCYHRADGLSFIRPIVIIIFLPDSSENKGGTRRYSWENFLKYQIIAILLEFFCFYTKFNTLEGRNPEIKLNLNLYVYLCLSFIAVANNFLGDEKQITTQY